MRIISGEFRGRTILPPPGLTTRPITDRVKTNLFNILYGRCEGASVLDLFCGTGSMGLEAISRGARFCTFAELDRAALALLDKSIQAMHLEDRSRVWRGDIMLLLPQWLAELAEPVDLAFVDPPYAMAESWDWQEASDRLLAPVAERLTPAGLVIFRCPRILPVPAVIGPLRQAQRRDYGTMSLVFLGKAE